MKTRLLLSILASGCKVAADPDLDVGVNTKVAAVDTFTGCVDPTRYGGIPDDDSDDRLAIQAAIDEASGKGGGRVCLHDGRWRVSRAPLGSFNRFAALTIHAPRIELSGNGPGTVIEVVGDQGAAPIYVISIDSGASDVTLRNFVVDTSGMTNTGEQTHAVQINATIGAAAVQSVEDIRLDRVTINHPSALPMRKGDCLRLVGGQEPAVVRRVNVIASTFTSCARSGIAIQRGVHDLVIMGNQFTHAEDQDIDSEPTSPGGNSGLTIVGNIFRDTAQLAQADWSVTLVGYDGPMNAVTLSNNVFEGRGVSLYRSANTVISGNTFNSTMETGYGVIDFGHEAETIIVSGNTIRRRGVDGPLIRIVHGGGRGARSVTISGNEMIQETLGGGIIVESAVRLSVVNNGIEWIQPAPKASGVQLRSTIVEAEATTISGNRLSGSIRYGIYLGAAPYPFNTTSVVGNLTTGAVAGLRCEQVAPGLYKQPIVFAANNFNTPSQCVATLAAARP